MKLPKFFWKIIGILLVLSYFVPFPLGSIRLALGLSILVCASLPFALFIQARRRQFSWFNNSMVWMENKLGKRVAGNLMWTRPENDPRIHFNGPPGATPTGSPLSDDEVRKDKN